ncbi:DUF4276 family protein [Dickeya dianthicola]|uniref:DUF4276 family protein n=1 Tax=Dickeya dianthicola TaxID=204039 RepID=UPI003016B94F
MTRICIVCEGPTEVEFIQQCIEPHLRDYGKYVYPSIIQSPSGRGRGGRVTVERLASHMHREYYSTDRITSLVDFYGFQRSVGRSKQQLESDILSQICNLNPRVVRGFILPYVQMYEFEGILFSDIEKFEYVLDGWDEEAREKLLGIKQQFSSPEDINNSRQTAPSKRLEAIFSNGAYSKTEHGPIIAEEIGLTTIRQQCPGFNDWLSHLECW